MTLFSGEKPTPIISSVHVLIQQVHREEDLFPDRSIVLLVLFLSHSDMLPGSEAWQQLIEHQLVLSFTNMNCNL